MSGSGGDNELRLKPWIHVFQDYVGRYEENITSKSFLGLCTTQFTSCWPIIIVYKPSNTNDHIKASLIHYGDESESSMIKLEIDHLIENKTKDEFVSDNCYIFIYRQLGRKMVWERQRSKIMLLKMLEMLIDKKNYTIIDLPPNKDDDNKGFIGIKFDDLNKIRSIKSNEINTFITKSMVLLERTERDNFIHKNPIYLIRHPKEFHLRCSYEVAPISGLYDKIQILSTSENQVIFDKSHWVNIDKYIGYNKLCVFMKKFKKKRENNNNHFDILNKCGELYKNMHPIQAMNSPHTDGTVTSMAVAVELWNNNFDLKQLFQQNIQEITERIETTPQFLQITNKMYNIDPPFRKQQVLKWIKELRDILKRKNWISGSERLYVIANELYPLNCLTALSQIYGHILLYIYQCKMEQFKKLSNDYSIKGKEMYINKRFDESILYFRKSLEFGIICYVDPSLELVRAYYNLGASYQNNNDLMMAEKIVLIAQNICNQLTNKENVNLLSKKISNRLLEIIINLSLNEMT